MGKRIHKFGKKRSMDLTRFSEQLDLTRFGV